MVGRHKVASIERLHIHYAIRSLQALNTGNCDTCEVIPSNLYTARCMIKQHEYLPEQYLEDDILVEVIIEEILS